VRSLPALALLAALAAAAMPAAGASRLVLAASGEADLRLRLDAQGARVETAGANVPLPLPAGGAVDAIVATRDGWIAAGSVPVVGGRELALWEGRTEKAAAQPVPPPPGRRGALRSWPLPLVRDGELVGLAWLEGEAADRFGVWASAWDGHRWEAPVVVAGPGKGSQLALTGAVLADGTWALAWSAYDGEDDEILWSRRRDGRFTSPRPVAAGNAIPDVTPALRAAGDGALLTWSRYDGNDYRLVLSRLDGGRWQPPVWAAGAGTSFPRWQGDALVFRDAAAGAWVAANVDALDRLRPVAAVAAPADARPVLARDDGTVRLVFP
jgi:hypothetical protein